MEEVRKFTALNLNGIIADTNVPAIVRTSAQHIIKAEYLVLKDWIQQVSNFDLRMLTDCFYVLRNSEDFDADAIKESLSCTTLLTYVLATGEGFITEYSSDVIDSCMSRLAILVAAENKKRTLNPVDFIIEYDKTSLDVEPSTWLIQVEIPEQ